jgi:hypothetical protein
MPKVHAPRRFRSAWLVPAAALLLACGGGARDVESADAGAARDAGPEDGGGAAVDSWTQASCGNGRLDALEACDGAQVDEQTGTCDANWLGSGAARCTARCTLDVTGCENTDYCAGNGFYGDGQCDACERLGGHADPDCAAHCQADGVCASWFDSAVGDWSCEAAGLGHDPDCGTCGNGVVEGSEYCDGTQFAAVDFQGAHVVPDTCEKWGYSGGTLRCTAHCVPDFSGCTR